MNQVAPELEHEVDRWEIAELITTSASMAAIFSTAREKAMSLGLSCGMMSGAERSYAFSLMTASATKRAEQFTPSPLILELGVGTGVNAVAALLTSKTARYIGFEKNPLTAEYAKFLIKLYNLESRAEIIEGDFLQADFSDFHADVVVNENIDAWLATEPQLEAARAVLPATHERTLFIPLGFDIHVRLRHDGPFHYFGRVDHRNPIDDQLILSHDFGPGEVPSHNFTVCFASALLNYEGEPVMRKIGGSLRELILDGLAGLNFGELSEDAGHRMILTLKCPPESNTRILPEKLFSLEEINESEIS